MFSIKLENYYRSGHSGIFIVSHEEKNILRDIKLMTERVSADIGEEVSFSFWSVASGLNGAHTIEDVKDPIAVFEYMRNQDITNAVFVLTDFHMFLDDRNPVLFRIAKEALDAMKMRGVCVIMTGCKYNVPEELSKHIVRLDYSLPNRDDIVSIMDAINQGIAPRPEGLALDSVIDACLGMTSAEIENAIALSIRANNAIDASVLAAEKAEAIKSCGFLEVITATKSLDDIGGMDEAKSWIQRRAKAFTPAAKSFGLPAPKGWLILGPPGTGKSLMSEIVSTVLNVPLIRWDIGSCFGSLVGQSEQNVAHVFTVLKAFGRCVVWLDEIEKALSGSQSSSNTDGGTSARVFGKILTFMQENEGVFFSATANAVNQLPPELLRKGRFDEIFFVDLPGSDDRKRIWNIHLNKHAHIEETAKVIDMLSSESEGFTGAEIEQAVIDAMYTAFDCDSAVSPDHLIAATQDSVPVSRTMGTQIEQLREWASTRCRMASVKQTKKESHGTRKIK